MSGLSGPRPFCTGRMRWVLEHDDVCVALLSEIRHVSKAVAQRGAWLHPIWNIELAVLEANVPTQCVEWVGHGDCNPRQPAKSLSREARTELQLRRSCESWSDIRFARPPGRSETCENHRETIKIIRTRTENEHKHQHLPSTKIIGKRPKVPSPVRPSLRAGQFFPSATRCRIAAVRARSAGGCDGA